MGKKGGGESTLSDVLPIRTLILSEQGLTLMTSFNLNKFLRDPISKYNHTGVRASPYEGMGFGGIIIQSITVSGILVLELEFRLECENVNL